METGSMETRIEALIDEYGLANVLEAVSIVCEEKADHIRASYQDDSLARDWGAASLAINVLAGGSEVANVSPGA